MNLYEIIFFFFNLQSNNKESQTVSVTLVSTETSTDSLEEESKIVEELSGSIDKDTEKDNEMSTSNEELTLRETTEQDERARDTEPDIGAQIKITG